MVRTLLAIMLLPGSLVLTTHAQKSDTIVQDVSKPSIYLTFERFGENGSVWLRLHNNTRWAISFRTDGPAYQGASVTPLVLGDGRYLMGLVDNLEVVPEYFIEHVTDRVTTNGQYWCTSVTSWLPAGRSVVFSFPRKKLQAWEQIYVKFIYEWEQGGHDPEHRVKFYGDDLSKFE